jgi:hypothetical protein
LGLGLRRVCSVCGAGVLVCWCAGVLAVMLAVVLAVMLAEPLRSDGQAARER